MAEKKKSKENYPGHGHQTGHSGRTCLAGGHPGHLEYICHGHNGHICHGSHADYVDFGCHTDYCCHFEHGCYDGYASHGSHASHGCPGHNSHGSHACQGKPQGGPARPARSTIISDSCDNCDAILVSKTRKGQSFPKELEFLDEQFQCYLRIAKSLMPALMRPKDIQIGTDMIKKCESMHANGSLDVKKNISCFFRCFLKVLNWTSKNQPKNLYDTWYTGERHEAMPEEEKQRIAPGSWLEENLKYIATKCKPNGTVVMFSTKSHDTKPCWHEGGLKLETVEELANKTLNHCSSNKSK